MDEFEKQALTEHLAELRKCLIISLGAIAAGFALAYSFTKEIGQWFLKPLFDVLPEGASLVFMSFQEGFFFT